MIQIDPIGVLVIAPAAVLAIGGLLFLILATAAIPILSKSDFGGVKTPVIQNGVSYGFSEDPHPVIFKILLAIMIGGAIAAITGLVLLITQN